MKIREVMRHAPLTISESDRLGVAQFTMARAHVRHLPVMRGDRLVGILSERDVLTARAHAEDQGWWEISVHDAMHAPQTAGPDDSLTEVAGRMASAKIGAMPIIERGKLLGIATISDVLDAEVHEAMRPPSSALTASDVMTPRPVTVRPETSVAEAVDRMLRGRIRHLPVIDGDARVVGMLSERDLRAAIGEPSRYRDVATARLRVSDVMTSPAVTVPAETPVSELAKRFADDRIGALPVIGQSGALIGIVSYVDALRLLA